MESPQIAVQRRNSVMLPSAKNSRTLNVDGGGGEGTKLEKTEEEGKGERGI
jgi:hypothetical protein